MEHTLAAIANTTFSFNASSVIIVAAMAGLIGLSAYAGMKLTLSRTSINKFKRIKNTK